MLPTTRRGESPFEMLRDIDRMFEMPWYWRGDGGRVTEGATAAYPVDIREDDNHVYVEAELPGFTKEEIEVTMEQGVLTINAQRKAQEERKGEEQHLSERRFTRVSRSFRLPTPVDENNIDAHLEGGVLTLSLPKREEVKPRRIEVK